LEYFIKAQKLNQRQAQWALYLSRFDFTLKYVPGARMGKTDRLSRRLDWKVSICYELRSLGLDNRTTLILSNIRELDRDPFTN